VIKKPQRRDDSKEKMMRKMKQKEKIDVTKGGVVK
jgi:hypothetical protein